ncbi:MAG: aminoglycoside phosphotransferase family protein, partial [Oscillospiraceae bacterium]
MEMDRVIGVRSDKTVFRAKDKVIKMFDDGYSKSDILNEALNQSRIEEMGMNIPKILEVGKIDGRWAIIQEFIEGKQLEYLMGTNPEKMAEYLDNMAQLQWDMHQKKPPLLNKLTDTLTRKIAACDLNATVRYDIIAQLQEMPKGNSLCHGDFVPGNIIVGTKGEYFMLDFSHSCVGNPLADVAKSYILLGLHFGEDIAEKYIALYCDKSGGKP